MDKPWMIKEIGRLGLGYITKLEGIYQKEGKTKLKTSIAPIEEGLEIYMWADDFSCRWTIGSFHLSKENCFEFEEVGDRMANPALDWVTFGELYNLGREMLDSVERNLD